MNGKSIFGIFRGQRTPGKTSCVLLVYIYFYFFYQHAGFLFPERREGPEAMFTPPQTQPLQNYPASVRTDHRDRESWASAPPDESLMRLVSCKHHELIGKASCFVVLCLNCNN
jgi:hypothetical protein